MTIPVAVVLLTHFEINILDVSLASFLAVDSTFQWTVLSSMYSGILSSMDSLETIFECRMEWYSDCCILDPMITPLHLTVPNPNGEEVKLILLLRDICS